MAQGVRGALGAVVRPVMRRWDRIPMRVQGRITVALPLVAVVVSACLGLVGNAERVGIETDIQRRFEMTGALDGLSSLMVNAETGMRGFLLTGEGTFLEPFDQAARELPSAGERLAALAAREPGPEPRVEALGRVEDLRTLSARQMADLTFQRDAFLAGTSAADPGLRGHLAYGKELMDRIRADVEVMRSRERQLLTDRIADINAIRVRDYVSVAVALIAALAMRFVAWYLFRTGTLRRVERLTANVRDIREGHPPSAPPPAKSDHLGDLEREVHLLAR